MSNDTAPDTAGLDLDLDALDRMRLEYDSADRDVSPDSEYDAGPYAHALLAAAPALLAMAREAERRIAVETERYKYFAKCFYEACDAAVFTCPRCREPYTHGDGPWRCRECDLETIGTGEKCPTRVPLAAIERDEARAQRDDLANALRTLALDWHGQGYICQICDGDSQGTVDDPPDHDAHVPRHNQTCVLAKLKGTP